MLSIHHGIPYVYNAFSCGIMAEIPFSGITSVEDLEENTAEHQFGLSMALMHNIVVSFLKEKYLSLWTKLK